MPGEHRGGCDGDHKMSDLTGVRAAGAWCASPLTRQNVVALVSHPGDAPHEWRSWAIPSTDRGSVVVITRKPRARRSIQCQ